ncbi:DUF2935 domain-containing protein [Ectobacillus ponti]|uniref:DUF2935 domain-containing protein n=1 Tax=Ectobacillus ponti TaxID=2961894 RepID=A0AA42BPX8_9BACI|nr:DUF2935 domain-containing protein [Ectobacillus ponti]MCP8967884.1 DUF2935 domain-containing protein [Ectobacillus ponti]
MISPWEEHLFWLEVLQDHAYFVRDHLSPSEAQWVQAAQQYIQAFEGVLQRLQQLDPHLDVSHPDMQELAKAAWPAASGYYQLEGQLQKLRIANQINLNLTPTYLNGTLGENQEYLRMLPYMAQGRTAPLQPLVDVLDLWLEDQLGHAVLLRNVLDPSEGSLIRILDGYIARFQSYLLQNHHMRKFLRFTEPNFPRQTALALEVGQTTLEMNGMIQQTVARFRNTEVLSRTTLRFLEHHFPETCYFVKKLAFYAPALQEAASACSLRRPSFS